MEQKALSEHLICKQKAIGEQVNKELTSYESLVTRIRAGNRAAAAELVDLYYMQIYLYMRRFGYSVAVSEDLTQETFLQIWQHIGQLRSSRALNSWIYKVASNVSRLYLRKKKGKDLPSIEEIVIPADDSNEGNIAELNEQVNMLRKAVIELPIKFREVIILHYLQSLSINEGAQVLGVREGTFKSRLSRALTILRKKV
ncbi:MAG: RNA polymerase sigma factor [Planctomycetota bacterium]|jgi:RNA polymerase sigma-70 factor (ECF subfamily)